MKRFVVVTSLLLLASSHLAHSRSIADDRSSVSDGADAGSGGGNSLQWPLSATTVTCEPVYGFLPCSTNGLGLLFMIVVYNILLSIGGKYVAAGSNLWLQIIGPGVVGGSVFQFLGTIPQLVMMLLPLITGSAEEAQERVTSGMGMVLGGVAISLTLIWGLTVVIGSSEPSKDDATTDTSEPAEKEETAKGSSVVTDVETSWTARLVLLASVPYLILELQNAFTSSSGKRVIILIALVITVALLFGYILFQSFQPWIQNRCFEFMVDKYAKDKLLELLTTNGRPNIGKIQKLFNKIDKDNTASVTAAEIRVLVLGVKMEDDDISTNRVLDEITTYFDTSGDGGISQDEFVVGMIKLALTLLDQTPAQIIKAGNNKSQITSPEQEALLGRITSTSQAASSSWSIYLRATLSLALGLGIASSLSQPLMRSIMAFAEAANVSSFWVSYVVLPLALHYNTIVQTITSASQKSEKTNSLLLSSLYGSVFMGNVIGLLPFLVPVYLRDLSSEVSTELHLVLLICLLMGGFTSFNTTFPRWTGYVALVLYPVSLGTVYVFTSLL